MALKAVVENLNDVPEQFHELYTERNGKYEITGIEGMKTQGDVDRLQQALTKERGDHKAVKDKFAPLSNYDINDVLDRLGRFDELAAAAEGKLDDAKIEELVGKRINGKLAPVQRELETYKGQLTEAQQQLQQYQQREVQRTIFDEVRKAGTASKVLPEAMEDALLLAERVFEISDDGRVVTKDNVGVTPGIDAAVWFSELQTKRPHWWAPSFGGGGRGNGNNVGGKANPWTHENWNLTEQGNILKANRQQAENMARSAGTSIGGPRPPARR